MSGGFSPVNSGLISGEYYYARNTIYIILCKRTWCQEFFFIDRSMFDCNRISLSKTMHIIV